MSAITIAVINRSTILSELEAARMTAAIQKQVSRDFAPLWDLDATVMFVHAGAAAPPGAWAITLLDTADVEDALGYHDEDASGRPFGRVFCKTTLADGEKISVTLSHEVLELLADPYVRLTVFVENGKGGRLYAYESADAVETTTYQIDGIEVSNFVTPAWFDPQSKTGARLDFLKKVKKPFQLLHGGYISIYDLPGNGHWNQVKAEHGPAVAHALPAQQLPKPGSRRERRNHPGKRHLH